MNVVTTRFKELQVEKADLIRFGDGLVGLDSLKEFFIVDPGEAVPILWLQSTSDPAMACPIIEPALFLPDYTISPGDLPSEALELAGAGDARTYVILTIPKDPEEMTANLKAPIVINTRTRSAKQVILQDGKLSVRHPMYKDLRARAMEPVSDDSMRSRAELRGAVLGRGAAGGGRPPAAPESGLGPEA